jgi:hypothetical protein
MAKKTAPPPLPTLAAKKTVTLVKGAAKPLETAPPSAPEAKRQRGAEPITVTLPANMHRALKRWCADHEATLEEAIKESVRQMLRSDAEAEADADTEPARGNGFLQQMFG